MPFDWLSFFAERGIAYSERGSNVSSGNVVIHCPFCGAADQGQHLSVSTDGRGWRCFRNHDHAGKGPTRLIQALLACTWQRAAAIAGTDAFLPGADEFQARIKAALGAVEPPRKAPLAFLPEFRMIDQGPAARPYRGYLERRGYSPKQIIRIAASYGLRYAPSGPFRGRIIFPVWDGPELLTWTGRAISKKQAIRYRTLTDDIEKAKDGGLPCAMGPISDYLLFFNKIRKSSADTIYLVEGPFDALKVSVLGRKHGAIATCFFTSSPSHNQISLLHEVLPRYKNRFLLLDRGMISQTLRTIPELSALDVIPAKMPAWIKDPGEFTPDQFIKMHRRNLKL